MTSRDHLLRPCIAFAIVVCGLVPASSAAQPRTLRVDYYHTGNATQEVFALDRVVVEPLPWPGDSARGIDDTNLGKYRFDVIDRSTRRVVFSRGFASIFGEWETTGEAASMHRTFSESLRFPMPDAAGAGGREEARSRERLPRSVVRP